MNIYAKHLSFKPFDKNDTCIKAKINVYNTVLLSLTMKYGLFCLESGIFATKYKPRDNGS